MSKYGILVVSFVGIFTAVFWYYVINGVLTHRADDLFLLGVVILALGLVFTIFYSNIGKKTYHKALSFKPGSTDSPWIKFDERNTQRLYLVIALLQPSQVL